MTSFISETLHKERVVPPSVLNLYKGFIFLYLLIIRFKLVLSLNDKYTGPTCILVFFRVFKIDFDLSL